jgi:hypothetical protein
MGLELYLYSMELLVCILMDYVGLLTPKKYQHSRHLTEAGMRTLILTTL